jgi:protein KRI1
MPTRFKYTRSKPTAFGLTAAEILLATDKELDAIAGLRHIAPYRKQGLGMQGRGISKRIYDLKQTLKNRKWGEEMEVDEDGKPRTKSKPRPTDSGWSSKRKADGEGEEEGGSKKKKRLGKKQRQREREANGFVGPDGHLVAGVGAEGQASSNRYEGGEAAHVEIVAAPVAEVATGEAGEGKTKRRKKKSSQKAEELKIFD